MNFLKNCSSFTFIWSVIIDKNHQATHEGKYLTMKYNQANSVETPVVIAVPHVVYSLAQINTTCGT